MKNSLQTALEYLNKNYLINADIIEPLKLGAAELLFASERCVLAKDKLSDVLMMQTEDLQLADNLLDNIPQDVTHIVAHNATLADFVGRKMNFDRKVPCYQAVYRKETAPIYQQTTLNIRLLHENEADDVCAMYGCTKEHADRHIKHGFVYGGFDGDNLAAIVGLHLQGSMGLLVVSENHRRKGYGEIMERFLIDRQLKNGLVPYCHVVEGNIPSLTLQRKLGLEISDTMLYWMGKEKK